MLSLRELHRASEALDTTRRGARLERVVQHGAHELVLTLSGGAGRPARDRCQLLLSCAPRVARLALLPGSRPAPPELLPLAQYLRAHVEGGRLAEARLEGEDRQARLRFETRQGDFSLLLSLLGPRSNVYVLDGAGCLVGSLRPLEQTRRDLAGGQPWRAPATPPPAPGEDRFAGLEGEALLAAIEAHYGEREAASGADERCRRLRQALKKQGDALARKRQALERDLAEAAKAEEYARLGELLKGALRSVRAGASEVEASDWETGERVTIPLDPGLAPAANLERYFKKQRKAERRGLRARQELGAVAARLEENAALRDELEAEIAARGPASPALEAFAARPELRRLLERYFPPLREPPPPRPRLGKRELPTRLLPRRYRTGDGLEVWVGRNDEGNDLLTTRLARGRDLFFHLEASPGSHVVLRCEGPGEPPDASVLAAAELAVHFSKQRHATRASVHVAAIKDVSKPRGAKPGLVYVHRGRTLQLRRDPERLERVLAARIREDETGG